MARANDLIFDIGMHTGEDTAFYLKKGFRVVAIEANESLVAGARERFADEIDAGRLTLYNVAIAEREGTIDFFLNHEKDDWGTTSPEFVARNEKLGTRHTKVEVPCVRLQRILRECGVPYYAKIDIEGADLLCLQALLEFQERPRYVSIEASLRSFEAVLGELAHLWVLGYRRFKVVNQARNRSLRCPDPPLEGLYVDQRFDGYMSGPFGEEAPGEWRDAESTLARYRHILDEQRRFGAGGRYDTPLLRPVDRFLRRVTGREPAGWYDIHGKLCA
ncbi:MAG TPA: FkbM family methyltransferase [Myxococcota bacterium]|nr:FkbM family methyltransferase [Myxococcota bacterium]